MSVSSRILSAGLMLAALGACAERPDKIVAEPPPAVPVAAPAPMLPAGVSPTMAVPALLADGTYPTPNRNLTPAATLWHFRVALNVAALACRGAQGDAIVADYNAMLARRRRMLTAAETRYAAEWQGAGGDWRDRYDDAMTRLYNYFSLSPARAPFCAAAAQVLTQAAALSDDALPGFAVAELHALDRPFTDVYRDVDAWRGAQAGREPPRTVIAFAAPTPAVHPRLELDPSVFQDR